MSQESDSQLLFLSYKSEDANLVRAIAERLIASGLNVWFNEYRILPDDYDRCDEMIDDGLSKATHAVVLTNNRWAQAKWCRYEMDGLLAAIPDHRRIVEVGIPSEDGPREVYPALLEQEPIVFRGNPREPSTQEVRRVVQEIARRFDFAVRIPNEPPSSRTPVWLPRFGVSFNPGRFRLSPASTLQYWIVAMQSPNLGLVDDGFRTVVFRGIIAEHPVSFDAYVWNYQSPIRGFTIDEEGISDDRAVHKSYLRYARQWLSSFHGAFGTLDLRALGLHLMFVGGRSQFALTYSARTHWERRYAVRIPRDDSDGDGEVGFVFAVPSTERYIDLERFCEVSPAFDEVAKTCSVRYPGSFATLLINLPAILGRVAMAGVILWLLRNVWLTTQELPRVIALSFEAGYLLADSAHWCLRAAYRRASRTLEPALWDVLSPANPFRLMLGIIFHGVFWPVIVALRWIFLGVLVAALQLALPFFLVGWLVVGKPSEITPEWTTRRDLVLLIAAAVLGALTNYHAIGMLIARYIKRPTQDEEQTTD